ncbi:hypothetical protein ON010_g11736 [Phytophthora cinnamomi]|nr:hypothetical protein ON010_g11736 [Phytophthora cinnamomi]
MEVLSPVSVERHGTVGRGGHRALRPALLGPFDTRHRPALRTGGVGAAQLIAGQIPLVGAVGAALQRPGAALPDAGDSRAGLGLD